MHASGRGLTKLEDGKRGSCCQDPSSAYVYISESVLSRRLCAEHDQEKPPLVAHLKGQEMTSPKPPKAGSWQEKA